jgi:hypothetical protein
MRQAARLDYVHTARLAAASALLIAGGLVGAPYRVASADACPQPHSAPETACFLPINATVQESIRYQGGLDAYKIEIPSGGMTIQASAVATNGGDDVDLYLSDDSGTMLIYSVHESDFSESIITTLLQGVYYVYVFVDPGRDIGRDTPYTVSLIDTSSQPSECYPINPAKMVNLGSINAEGYSIQEQMLPGESLYAYLFEVQKQGSLRINMDHIPFEIQANVYTSIKCSTSSYNSSPIVQWFMSPTSRQSVNMTLPSLGPGQYVLIFGHLGRGNGGTFEIHIGIV